MDNTDQAPICRPPFEQGAWQRANHDWWRSLSSPLFVVTNLITGTASAAIAALVVDDAVAVVAAGGVVVFLFYIAFWVSAPYRQRNEARQAVSEARADRRRIDGDFADRVREQTNVLTRLLRVRCLEVNGDLRWPDVRGNMNAQLETLRRFYAEPVSTELMEIGEAAHQMGLFDEIANEHGTRHSFTGPETVQALVDLVPLLSQVRVAAERESRGDSPTPTVTPPSGGPA